MDQMSQLWSEKPSSEGKTAGPLSGLAIGALVFGVVSVAVAPFISGMFFGIVGVVLAVICLIKHPSSAKMAGWGLGLSIAGILVSIIASLVFYGAIVHRGAWSDKSVDEDEKGCSVNICQSLVGKSLPDITWQDIDGKKLTLSDFKGRWVLLHFWSPSDLLSRDAAQSLISLRESMPESEMVLVGVTRWSSNDEVRGVGQLLKINYSLVCCDRSEKDAPKEVVNKLPDILENFYESPVTIYVNPQGVIQYVLDKYHSQDALRKGFAETKPN